MKLIFSDLKGLECEKGITRRDPSPVIKVDGKYYVYYTKAETISGYDASVWVASSEDSYVWKEECEAIPRGLGGKFDEGSCFTPSTLLSDGCVYIFYTCVPKNFDVESTEENGLTAITVAKSESPLGPFVNIVGKPIIKTGIAPAFDSHRVDDSCLVKHDGKFYLYYKGRQLGLTPKETKMGIAIAEKAEGPYVKYEANPITDSGHEVCVYPCDNGFMSLFTDTGPNGHTYQFSEDGINFKVLGKLAVPQSVGPYREDNYENNKSFKLKWGVFHDYIDGRPYVRRFDVDYDN